MICFYEKVLAAIPTALPILGKVKQCSTPMSVSPAGAEFASTGENACVCE